MINRTKRKLLAVLLLFIMVVGVFNISPTLPAEAKTVTKISKTSPSGSGFKLRLGNTKKLKMTLYTDGYRKPAKKVTLSADQEGIVSIGKVSYKKNTYYDWYGKKHISYNAAASVDLWFSERDLVDNAVKALGYNKNSMTNSQLDEAVEKASKKGVVGHYTFCLYADHNDALGFASSSGGSLGHAMWRDGIVAKYTFKEMDDYVTEYLNEIGY